MMESILPSGWVNLTAKVLNGNTLLRRSAKPSPFKNSFDKIGTRFTY